MTNTDPQPVAPIDNVQQAVDSIVTADNRGRDLNPLTAIEAPKPLGTGGYHHKVKRMSANAVRRAKSAAALLESTGRPIVNGSTRAGLKMRDFKAQCAADCGGQESLSIAQSVLIDLAARQLLLLDAIDSSMFEHGMVVNRGKRSVFPIVRERQAIVDSLVNTLKTLGLDRRAGKVQSLHELLAEPEGLAS